MCKPVILIAITQKYKAMMQATKITKKENLGHSNITDP